ncbi:MAG: relaxase domain-containing protein [Gammaproteobacteria bacterium]|nr:relaxase domain-containing protein [Gammaproteobacteria bacterium]
MMTVKAVKSAGQAKNYFGREAKLEKEIGGYYSHDTAFGGGRWMGRGAEELGLKGAVGVHQFEKALEGHLPGGITIAPRPDGTHRPGNDCTFQAPKSFSIMALAAGDTRLIDVHNRAVEKAIKWIEENHQFARLGKGGKIRELTGKSVVAAFLHSTARPVNGEVVPHLHTHAVHVNATQRSDGKWVASNLGMDPGWEKAVGTAIYRMEAALGTKQCGYEIEVGRDGMFELAGVTREQIERWSPRSQQIEAELAKIGKTRETATAAEKNAANLRTRESKKSAKLDGPELIKQWRENAEREGLIRIKDEAMARAAAREAGGPVPTDRSAGQIAATAAVKSAVRHLSERENAFTESALLTHAAALGALGECSADDLKTAMFKEIADNRLLHAILHPNPKPGQEGPRFTTQQAINREETLMKRIERGKNIVAPIKESVADHLVTGKGQELNAQQVAVARHILTSTDRFTQVQGGAGVGKTTSMDVVRAEAQAAGFKVVGLAQTHKAKNGMADAGIEEVKTIALAIREFRGGAVPEKTLFIIDEASMASMKDVAELVRVIERSNNRAAVIGDLYQHQSVEAGSGFRIMQEVGGKVELNEIVRQKNPELRECVHAFMIGDAKQGAALAQKYMKAVALPPEIIREIGDDPAALREATRAAIAAQAASRYTALPSEKRREALIITGTNAMRKAANEAVRENLKAVGEIGQADRALAHLEKKDFSREQIRHVHNYKKEFVVQFQRDYTRGVSELVERDRQYTIKDIDQKNKTIKLVDKETGQEIDWRPRTAGKVTVSAPQDELTVSTGDKVIFRANDKEMGVTNGDHGTVKTIDGEKVEIELAKGGSVAIDPKVAVHIEHAYSGTSNSLQSATADLSIGAFESWLPPASGEQGYVTLSRARLDAEIFTDSPGDLAQKWGEWKGKENAKDIVDGQQKEVAGQEREPGAAYEKARSSEGVFETENPAPRPDLSPEDLPDIGRGDPTSRDIGREAE